MNNKNQYSQKPQPPSNIPRMQQQTPSFPQQHSNSNANFTFGGQQQQQSHSNNMPNPFGNSYQVQQQLPNVQPYSSQMQQDLFSFPQNNTNMSNPFSNQLQYQQQLPNPMPYQMQYSGPYQQLPNLSSYGYPQYQPNLTQLNDSNFVPADMGNLDYGDDEPIDEKTPVKPQTTSDQTKSLNDVIQLSMKIKQNTLQSSSFNEQTLPFLVSMKVESLKSEAKVPIDLVCVIDHSGSMGGEKIELVKNTFNFLLEYLDSSDRLSIIIFDDYASRLVPFIRTTEDNKKKILSALKNVYGNGGTDINLGLTHAFHALKKRRQTNPVSSIFLLSDGLDGGAQQKVKATLAKLEVPEDITINTFGYGRDHDPQLMTDIANLRDGNFYFIDKLDTVDEAFVDCLGGLINSIAQNAQIKIQPEQSEALNGVEIIKAYGDSSMWTHEGQTYTTKMATLMADKQKDYVLEIKIPKNIAELQDHQKSIKIASAEVTVTGLDNKQVTKNAELIITLLNETEEIKDQEGDDREVMKNFYRVKGAELLDNARKLADSNRNDEAKKLLQSFKEEVANSFLKEEKFIKNMIKDMDKALEYLNPVVYQDYGRHNMYSNQRAQMQQRTDLNMFNCNQMPSQAAMTNQVKAMKAQPNFGGFF